LKQIIHKILNWVSNKSLLEEGEKVICAISGGKDSVAMTLLLKELGYQVVLAHVNFNLRGDESDEDEAFVRELAKKLRLPFYGKSVYTNNELQKGESIQLAARRIRYEWFEELSRELGIDKIATAHTANDNTETIIYNLAKGSGLKGITGIPSQNGKIIRPIKCLSTHEVFAFLESRNQAYRKDSSNASDKYSRNKIRHHLSPVLTEINPALNQTLLEHSERFERINTFYFEAIEKSKKELWEFNKKGWWQVAISNIDKAKENALLEHLLTLGFSETAILDIIHGNVSAETSNSNYRLINARNKVLLAENTPLPKVNEFIDIYKNGIKSTPLGNLSWQLNPEFKKENLSKPHLAFISLDNVETIDSLFLRNIKTGDKMQPFGLKGQKLLSDLFNDTKLNTLEKEKSLVLELNGEIIWWVGKRISDKFKITSKTKKWVVIHWFTNEQLPFEW
jgi:tRNA(Ile)-lysidine synthase